jgi:hypothetical protein
MKANQTVKEGRDSQLLLPVADLKTQWTKKGKEELHSCCQNSKRDRGERYAYFERFYRNGSAPLLREIKLIRRAFVSINRMRAGHSSLKASLNRFNIVSTAECECGDGLQIEKHIFWDCKWYEEQREILRVILYENSKKNTQSLEAGIKKFLKGVCYFINNIPIFI